MTDETVGREPMELAEETVADLQTEEAARGGMAPEPAGHYTTCETKRWDGNGVNAS